MAFTSTRLHTDSVASWRNTFPTGVIVTSATCVSTRVISAVSRVYSACSGGSITPEGSETTVFSSYV